MQNSLSSNLVAMTPEVYLSSEMKASSVQSKYSAALIFFLWQERNFVIARTLLWYVWFQWSGIPLEGRKKRNNLFPHWEKFQIYFTSFVQCFVLQSTLSRNLRLLIVYPFINSSAFLILSHSWQNWISVLSPWLKQIVKVCDSIGLMVNYQEEKLWPT